MNSRYLAAPPDETLAVERSQAARLLQAAHAAGPDQDDAVDWAFTAMPDRRAARRLKIRQLLRHGDYEAANTLIAQGLLIRPTDAGLSLLRATSLFQQGRYGEAARELNLVLARRPHHGSALELAGKVTQRLGDPTRAAQLFERADKRIPRDRTRASLIDVLLMLDPPDTKRARAVLGRMDRPSAHLQARVLRAQGRCLEAIEKLETARTDPADPDPPATMCALIDVLEESANASTLRRHLESVKTSECAVQARAGLAWLAIQRNDASAANEQYAALESARGTNLVLGMTADRLLGLLAHTMGNLNKAAKHFEDALAFCRKAGYQPELAWSCSDYADTLLQRNQPGDRQKATSLLDESLAISSELGMKPLLERVLTRREILKA